MNTAILIRQRNYFAWGDTLAEARKNYKKVSGRTPTNLADIVLFKGSKEDLERIEISDIDGSVRRPESVTWERVN